MKKIFALILAMVLCIGLLAACGNGDTKDTTPAASDSGNTDTKGTTPAASSSGNTDTKGLKLGFIFLHDENSTYDLNFMNAAKEAIAALGLTEDQHQHPRRTGVLQRRCRAGRRRLQHHLCRLLRP